MDWEVSWKRKSEVAELNDDGRHSKRIWNAPNITFPTSNHDLSHEESMGTSLSSTPFQNTEIICYGALCDAKLKSSRALFSALSINTWDRVFELEVYSKGYYYAVRHNKDRHDTSILDLVTTNVLKPLQGWPEIKLTAVIAIPALIHARKNSGNTIVIDTSINILGPRSLLNTVGDAITNRKGHLQHPYFLPSEIGYFNPHFFYPHGISTNLRHLIGPQIGTPEAARLAQGLGDVFDSLAKSEYSNQAFPALLKAIYAKGFITTALKSHQEEGVNFILAREDHHITTSATQTLQGAIGHQAFKSHHSTILGGIYADTMGLGKTLTMLSAILCMIEAATEFGRLIYESIPLPKTRATLVVVSSHQIIDVWKSEIQRHFRPGVISLCNFHGEKKAKEVNGLINHDIVVTTYQTLVSDRKAKALLQSIMWFRVVLDEAHWIRNSSSQQFKAACSLTAQRRWCLSGTPIQNSLDDLRSLIEFLHFQPFSEPRFFRTHIIEPLRENSHDYFRNLRLLMRTICFRRTSDLLSLPQPSTKEILIALTGEEQRLYGEILSASKKEYEEIVNMRSTRKKYCVLFDATMKLRRLCNHGTFQYGSANTQGLLTPRSHARKRNNRKTDIQEELLCAYCDGDNADIGTPGIELDVCPECSRILDNRSPSPASPFPPAITSECGNVPSSWMLNEQIQPTANARWLPREGSGFSSKLNAVVNNIQESPKSSKHLVFTSWRLTLDILEYLLASRGIPCLRIDGQTSFSERQLILARFRQDPGFNALLLSIRTSAEGLTLTVADRVHIVEPQWNPLVEEQAIGRAFRIGQERSVTIYKYIMKNTVEQNIVTLQEKKNQLVKISLDGCASDQVQQGLEDLLFVIRRDAT
ncbi:SNF2 family N-terminal domain-containing protein [Nemania abortiva]|nr:SNF2 family N-terminal domain-containing protein [Nemania abortiva]